MKENLLANDILDIFSGFRMPETAFDQYEEVGKDKLRAKILTFINMNKPIDFVMLGYPMKSTNIRDKVIGVLPDLAEEVSLKNFADFGYKIKEVYEPGINVNIANDGLIFSELLGVNTETIFDYQDVSMDMATDHGAPMSWYNLTSFYKGSLTMQRQKLVEQFGISDVELERRIMFDPDVNFLYKGMMRFMEEELAIREFPSRNQLHKAAKKLTRDMMLMNEAYSQLVNHEFSSSVRLSMHPSVNNGNKYSFQLIPSPRAWTSPWHCALLLGSDGIYSTVHRKDAEAEGYELIKQNNRPYYFAEA